MTRLLLALALLGCANNVGIDGDECVVVRTVAGDPVKCFTLCPTAVGGTHIYVIGCPAEAVAGKAVTP